MSTNTFDYDPEKALWKPGRRSFFFGLGAALVGAMLPDLPGPHGRIPLYDPLGAISMHYRWSDLIIMADSEIWLWQQRVSEFPMAFMPRESVRV